MACGNCTVAEDGSIPGIMDAIVLRPRDTPDIDRTRHLLMCHLLSLTERIDSPMLVHKFGVL